MLELHNLQYHGGTNFGRTAGGPFITTSYDYDAPIDEYGMLFLLDKGKRLNFTTIKQCEIAHTLIVLRAIKVVIQKLENGTINKPSNKQVC